MAARNLLLKVERYKSVSYLIYFTSVLSLANSVYYADNGLQQTLAYRHLPAREKHEMQQEILNLLGLNHTPKPKSHGTDNSAPKYLSDLYKSLLDQESGNLKVTQTEGPVVVEGETLSKMSLHAINDSDIIISFVNEFTHHFSHTRHDKDKRFWFDVSEVLPSQNIMEAELRLFRNLSHSLLSVNHPCNATIYEVALGSDFQDMNLDYVDDKILTKEEGWIMFNVTKAMMNWVDFPQKNLGLYISIKCTEIDREVNPNEVGLIGSNGPRDKLPFMLAFLKSSQNVTVRTKRESDRIRRSSADQDGWNPYLNPMDRYSAGRSCQRKTLYVSFRDLGWQEWIIAPEGYAAFFCDGECSFPLNAHMNATNHAIVQTLVHLMNPSIVPKPCCAPTKLSAIMVLYFDDNSNVILKKYRNMVVKSCGCH